MSGRFQLSESKAVRALRRKLFGSFATALICLITISLADVICLGQSVVIAPPAIATVEGPSNPKVTQSETGTIIAVTDPTNPSDENQLVSPKKVAPVGAALSGTTSKAIPDNRPSTAAKTTLPDVSIAIESPRSVMKIPEKPLASRSQSPIASPNQNPAIDQSVSRNAASRETVSKPTNFTVTQQSRSEVSNDRLSNPMALKPTVVLAVEESLPKDKKIVALQKPDSERKLSINPTAEPTLPASINPLPIAPKLLTTKEPILTQGVAPETIAKPLKTPEPIASAIVTNSPAPIERIEKESDQSLTQKPSEKSTKAIPEIVANPQESSKAISEFVALNKSVSTDVMSTQPVPLNAPPAAVADPLLAPTTNTLTGTANAAPELLNPSAKISPYWMIEGMLAIKAPVDRSSVVDLETLVWAALAHSPYVQSIRLTPLIRETEIRQAQGAFDPTQFVDSIWNDRSDPVGNTLTTGGPPRLNDKLMANKGGIRGKNTSGGNFEASQELNLHNSNSLFFVPRQQADTKMLMRYTQPLMRGAGQAYNRATITIAELNTAASAKDSNQALQTHVMDLSEAYWQLFYHRAQLLQLRRGVARIQIIANQLENRRDLDLLENQLFRARAAVKTFESRIARTNADIIDDEQRIRRFVNAPWIQDVACDEIVIGSQPISDAVVMTPEEELGAAFMNRPDVLAVRDEIQAAKVKLNVAENELRPTLNLVTDMYVRGLNGQYDVANSFADQFSNGRPAYSGGLEYERPRNLYLAKAIKRQRSLELQQLLFQLDDRLLDVSREVRSAVAEVNATFAELNASVGSTIATKSEVDYLESRWISSEFLESNQISLNLEQLLDAQQRLINTESSWALAQAQYMIALSRLRFATGTLLTLGQLDEPNTQVPLQRVPNPAPNAANP